jgi:hypothetical protein
MNTAPMARDEYGIELFRALGDEVEDLWLQKNYNEAELPAIAADALKRFDLPSKLSAWDVVDWSLREKELPPQRDIHGRFGDPPITIYSGPRFHIDLYFWFEGTTAIHQHGFCGAFQVMLGSSIHSWYEFDLKEKINTFCEIGDIRLKVCEILEVGDVQEIWGGRQYIHSLFHLDRPSATIVVRTDRSPIDLPQFSYEKPSLAIDPFFEHPATIKKMQMMGTLLRAQRAEADDRIRRWLGDCDLHTAFIVLSGLRSSLRSDHLKQMFSPDSAAQRFDGLLDLVIERHGPKSSVLRNVFEHYDMQDEMIRRRGYVSDPEHRFFMALLLNVDRRDLILDLIKHRYPETDPVEKILDWVFDLAETRVVGIDSTNALGIIDFGEVEMVALEGLLRGQNDEQIRKEFSPKSQSKGVRTIHEAITAVREAVIFRPLLRSQM